MGTVALWRRLLAEVVGTALLVTAVVGSGRRSRTGLTATELGGYTAAQILGAVGGSVLANVMFALPAVDWSDKDRSAAHLWLGEIVATTGLVMLVFALACSGRSLAAPAAVGAYIGAAYWFTSSTSFANPAVTIGRAFTDTFAGIAPSSVPGFVLAQLAGLTFGVALLLALYPRVGAAADQVVVGHDTIDDPAAVTPRPDTQRTVAMHQPGGRPVYSHRGSPVQPPVDGEQPWSR